MAHDTKKKWLRRASGALLLLVPVVALLFLGADSLAFNGSKLLDGNAFAPHAAKVPSTVRPAATADVPDVHLNVWEDTANRSTIRQ